MVDPTRAGQMAVLSPEVESRLITERDVWLCTLRRDGTPHMTPVWFVYTDGTWWIDCAATSVKGRNVLADPRVSLALPDSEAPVVAEGITTVHRRDLPRSIVEAFASKYDGYDITQPAGTRALLEVVVHRWLLAGQAQ